MFRFIGILLWLCPLLISAKGIDEVRTEFHGIDSEKKLNDFIEMVAEVEDERKVPYQIAALMKRAEYTSNPFKKLKFFSQGKQELEAFITSNPTNIEAHYVRLLIQSEVPEFLGYRQDVNQDCSFIIEHLDTAPLPLSYKKTIKHTMNELKLNLSL